jgi:hypothetical protein
MATDLS